MSGLALVPCELGGIVVESVIYGMFLVLFITCLYCLISKHRFRGLSAAHVNKTMLAASIVLFASITTHWILDITRLFQAFVGENPDPLSYYANLAIPVNVVKTGLYIFECTIADLILCYHLWIIWGRRNVICVFPLCTTVAFAVTGTGITYQFTRLKPGEQVFLSVCSRWITSAFLSTLVTNIYCTSFISYKIWSVNHALKSSMGNSSAAMRVIVIVVESAATYTCCSLATMTAYLLNSNFQFPGLDSTSPVVGLVFCLIIVRVSLGLDHQSAMSMQLQTLRGWAPGGVARPPIGLQVASHDEEYGMNRVNICISRHVETDLDDASLKRP